MATAAMATAAGAAALLYYTLGRKSSDPSRLASEDEAGTSSSSEHFGILNRRVRMKPSRAPSTWFEVIATLSETLRFTYAETLGKWPITDLAFGINFLMKRQGDLHVCSIYAGEGSKQLKDPSVLPVLKELLQLLTVCIHFSKKPFPLFLEATGYPNDCVLLQEPKAGILKPAFTIILDHEIQNILLLIRGTHSTKDTLTAVTGAVVPFHHTVLEDSGISNLVLGYAHCGMVAAARWIAQLATPILLKAITDYPDYKIKIVGHSLGGGTAALLTYILRERREFLSTHCVSFAPAACMTWELAESGNPFITSVINGSDLVPTFSAASLDDLRREVTASAWVNDFREQIERTRILRTILRSAIALSNRLSSLASASRASLPVYPSLGLAAKAGVASAWRPVSSGTQVVMKQAQTVAHAVVRTRPSLGITGWSCMGARHRGAHVSSSHSDANVSSTMTGTARNEENGNMDAPKTKYLSVSSQFDMLDVREEQSLEESYSREGTCSTFNQDSSWKEEAKSDFLKEFEGINEVRDHLPTDCTAVQDELSSLKHDHDADDDSDSVPAGQQNEVDELNENFLWHQLEQEMERHSEERRLEMEEEQEVARKIIQEEECVAATAVEMGGDCIVTEQKKGTNGREFNRFFPPGQIIHLVSFLPKENIDNSTGNLGAVAPEEKSKLQTGLFLTDRSLYGKVRLSRTMINDHYMPSYKRIIEILVQELESVSHDEYTMDMEPSIV